MSAKRLVLTSKTTDQRIARPPGPPRTVMCVDPLDQAVEEFGFARQAMGVGEQRSPALGTVLQRDGNVASIGWTGVFNSRCPQGQPMPAGQLYPSHWWVGIATNIVVSDESFEHVGDAPLAAAELGGEINRRGGCRAPDESRQSS
jgi:hypothetical protein